MVYQNIFKRYELKYLLTHPQKEAVIAAMAAFMAPDQYGRTTIRNLYFDTDNYRLIRRSLEKPVYKEKLRLRSYRQCNPGDPAFVELKKKYKSVVYKRRMALPEQEALAWLSGDSPGPDGQIADEVRSFFTYYGQLTPKVFLAYDRQAWYCTDGSDFRVTFDENILCRQEQLSLEAPVWGSPILPKDRILMEIKTAGGIPLWMSHVLNGQHIYKTTFSKYGTAYQKLIYPNVKGEFSHV